MAEFFDIHALLDNAGQVAAFVGAFEADINRRLWIEYPWLMRASWLVAALGATAAVLRPAKRRRRR